MKSPPGSSPEGIPGTGGAGAHSDTSGTIPPTGPGVVRRAGHRELGTGKETRAPAGEGRSTTAQRPSCDGSDGRACPATGTRCDPSSPLLGGGHATGDTLPTSHPLPRAWVGGLTKRGRARSWRAGAAGRSRQSGARRALGADPGPERRHGGGCPFGDPPPGPCSLPSVPPRHSGAAGQPGAQRAHPGPAARSSRG